MSQKSTPSQWMISIFTYSYCFFSQTNKVLTNFFHQFCLTCVHVQGQCDVCKKYTIFLSAKIVFGIYIYIYFYPLPEYVYLVCISPISLLCYFLVNLPSFQQLAKCKSLSKGLLFECPWNPTDLTTNYCHCMFYIFIISSLIILLFLGNNILKT